MSKSPAPHSPEPHLNRLGGKGLIRSFGILTETLLRRLSYLPTPKENPTCQMNTTYNSAFQIYVLLSENILSWMERKQAP